MNSNRIWILGSLALTAIVLVGGWFIAVAPMLAQAAGAESARVDVERQNAGHAATLDSLKSEFDKLPDLESQLAAQRTLVPAGADLPGFLRIIDAMQVSTGALVTSITVADGLPYLPVVAAVEAPVPGEDAPATAEGEKAALVVAADPAVSSGTAPIEFADQVTDVNFTAIPVSVTSEGTFEQVMAFVKGLQSGERLYLVTGVSVRFDETNGVFQADVTGFVYSLATSIPPSNPEPVEAVEATSTATG